VDITLTPYEARVIACLIEKAITTPDQYPLSLNALTNACNQKSNREPVLSLDESSVQDTLDSLMKERLVTDKSGFGSRTVKYQHRFCNSEFGKLKFSEQELGIICVLLLRGPQTPGELRTRTNRLCEFSDVNEVQTTLEHLMTRDDGPFVAKLSRESGKREPRYMQLFSGDKPVADTSEDISTHLTPATPENERIDHLEQLVSELRQEIDQLKIRIEQLESNPLPVVTEM
jgi:hypothetical protein